MADLNTLEGISIARNDLYNRLEKGDIPEQRALGMERLLRGQESLKVTGPIRLLSIVAKFKGNSVEKYAGPLLKGLVRFTQGEQAVKQIEDFEQQARPKD